jgi:hypothetical protein
LLEPFRSADPMLQPSKIPAAKASARRRPGWSFTRGDLLHEVAVIEGDVVKASCAIASAIARACAPSRPKTMIRVLWSSIGWDCRRTFDAAHRRDHRLSLSQQKFLEIARDFGLDLVRGDAGLG